MRPAGHERREQAVLSLTRDRFAFLKPGELVDGDLKLVLASTTAPDPVRGWVPAYHFEMRHAETGEVLGGISLRISNNDHIRLYAGHIGYGVVPQHRGHHYAARSCRLLFDLARAHGLTSIWITCNPDNYASRRTCELVGGVLVETVNVPKSDPVYGPGEERKCRYRVDL